MKATTEQSTIEITIPVSRVLIEEAQQSTAIMIAVQRELGYRAWEAARQLVDG